MEELSLHILDIVQNSTRAGASLVEFSVIEDSASDTLVIRIKDNGSGMSEEMVEKLSDPFFTTRTTRKVGLGIPLLNQMAQMCGGNVKIDSTPGVGTEVIATFVLSHIDRPPLGNIAATVWTVVISSPDTDFEYIHKINEREFSVSTREIRKLLGIKGHFTTKLSTYLKTLIESGETDLITQN